MVNSLTCVSAFPSFYNVEHKIIQSLFWAPQLSDWHGHTGGWAKDHGDDWGIGGVAKEGQPGKERAQGHLINVCADIWWGGEEGGSSSSQCCPVMGQEATGTNLNIRNSIQPKEKKTKTQPFSPEAGWTLEQVAWGSFWSFHPWGYWKLVLGTLLPQTLLEWVTWAKENKTSSYKVSGASDYFYISCILLN